MDLISDLFIQEDKCLVIWMYGSKMVRKSYVYPIITVCFPSNEKILVIEPENKNQKNSNAVIYNGDGSELVRVKSPVDQTEFICFADAYYVKERINLFFMSRHAYYGCVLDETGNVSGVYETR